MLPHPWRFKSGLAYHLGEKEANNLIKEYKMLVEYNGWFYPLSSLVRIFGKLPLPLFQNFEKRCLKNINLEELDKSKVIIGLDTHFPQLLLDDTGYMEFDISTELTPKVINNCLRKGEGKIIVSDKLGLFYSVFWLLKDCFLGYFSFESILKQRLKLRLKKFI